MSQWGHDFRPDYFRLADAARWLEASAIVASTATATPAGRERHRAAPRAARPGAASRRASTARTCRSPSCRARTAADKRRGIAAALAQEPARCRRSSTRARATAPTTLAGALGAALGRATVERLPRGPGPRAARGGRSGASWRGDARRRRGDERVRHGGRQGRRADGRARERAGRRSRPTTRRPAAPGATARPPARCCSPRGATRACTCSSSSAPRSTSRRSGAWPRCCSGWASRRPLRRRGWRAWARSPTRVRAIVGHLARAGVIRPAPSPLDRLRGRVLGPYDGARRGACRTVGGRGAARALEPVPLGVGVRRGRRVPARARSCATSATRPSPRADGAVLRRLRPVAGAGRAAAGRARRRAAQPRRVDLDAAIVEVVETAEPSGRAHADRGDPARRALAGGRASTPTTACRPTAPSPTSTTTRSWAASTS